MWFDRTRRTRRLPSPFSILLAVLALTLPACADDRPTVDEWQLRWNDLVTVIPAADDVSGLDRPACDDVLAELRDRQGDLFPTPDPTIEAVVHEWVRVAEEAFFECPPSDREARGFPGAYEELERLQAEVETVLEIDRSES